ncbi:hypothetical protein BDW02DRAFT_24526 [Decorospora gaudefroyi]|uniref:Uncharacterized protein n=1 Tax=Decorospora gaudefroyi TaxID=184978 RepID=A0A6A5KF19_9PLEO|nr:hypothetical protein BDW02DRAFT_24526 [Decorospora gaudefroyi]
MASNMRDNPRLPFKAEPLFHGPTHAFNLEAVFNHFRRWIAQDEPAPNDHCIRKVIEPHSPNIVEPGVAKSLKVLESLEVKFPQMRTYRSKQLNRHHRKPTEKTIHTVIGVMHSIISSTNAMPATERLTNIPTTYMHACVHRRRNQISWKQAIQIRSSQNSGQRIKFGEKSSQSL